MRKKIALLIMLLIAMFSFASVANASIYSSDYIARAESHIIVNSNGNLTISFSIAGRTIMDQIGVKTIILQERANSNSSWEEATTYSYEDYSNMMRYNTDETKSNVTYSNALPGYQYRAKVYFYAENGGYDSREYITTTVFAK